MYCKNCGKKLPDDARFCDRCNMSVRKKEDKMDLIVELKEERLARRKANAVKERLKKMQVQKRKRRNKFIVAVAAIIAIGLISMFCTYIIVSMDSENNNTINYTETMETPIATERATAQVVGGAEATTQPQVTPLSGTSAVSVNEDGYIETKIGSIDYAYPRGFEKKEPISNEILYLKDSDGGATIIANREATNSSAQELMTSYADKMGGSVVDSLAGDSWYTITISKGSEMYHRKGVLSNGILTYYEMQYPAASEKEGAYTENIEYMDEYFKA